MSLLKMDNQQGKQVFISADKTLPEITLRGTLLAIVLTILLAAANAFLGLKVGLTISASIPAAVIAMGVLRFFKNSNVLENNIVQTAASAGEALTSAISFTLPALIVIHFWHHFNYWASFTIAITGGILGVLFSVPLRRILLADKTLKFPEGTAIGKVLMASADRSTGFNDLLKASGIGALISLCQTGFKILADNFQLWLKVGSSVVGFGLGFNPALIGAGYIIGIAINISILVGIVIGWIIGVPVLNHIYGVPVGTGTADVANILWSEYIRYMGLGTIMIGGIWTVFTLIKPVVKGIKASIQSVMHAKKTGAKIPRTEKDLSIILVFWSILILLCPLYFMLNYLTGFPALNLSHLAQQLLNISALMIIIVLGFALASVCAYFAGLIGASASPLSSMALISLIISSLLVLLFLPGGLNLDTANLQGIAGATVAIVLTSLIACTASITLDTIQDLKAGHMLGATPWKQQVMLILGVAVAALIIPLIMDLLFQAYGLGGVMPRPNMDMSQMLLAPQAGLMAAIVQGIFTHRLQTTMMGIGALIGVLALVVDHFLKKRQLRFPALALGLGIYLPMNTTTALVIGGFLSYFVEKGLSKKYGDSDLYHRAHQIGLLLACGLVAGSALMGVVLAIPFALKGSADVLSLLREPHVMLTGFISLIVTVLLCMWIRFSVVNKTSQSIMS